MFRSIRWRLVISYILLAMLVVGVVGSITYQLAKNYAEIRETQGLRANAQAIALQAEPLLYSPFAPYKLQQLAETSAFLGDMRVRILDAQQRAIADSGVSDKTEQVMILVPGQEGDLLPGMIFYQYEPGSGLDLPDALSEILPPGTNVTLVHSQDGPWGKQFIFEEIVVSNETELGAAVDNPQPHHRSEAFLIHPIGDSENPIGYIELSEPLDFGTALLDQLKQALVTAGVGAVILAAVFGFWTSYRLAAPIKSLANTSAQMGAGNLSVRANLQTGGEIGELGDQFNQMADNLQTTIQQLENERDALRRFIADASHELRTPITALKNFNTLLQGSAAHDAVAQTEFLSESQNQIGRLEWITANLLDLSRLDAGLLDFDFTKQDLREVVEAAVSPFKTLAQEKGIALLTSYPDQPICLSIDRPQLEMAIGNLLDNALKFTAEGGEVSMTLASSAERVTLSVCDTGPGIPPQDLPHIFDRFYRGRSHSVEGSGLGLSIVKSIIEAHGAQIFAESKVGEGTSLTLIFPVNRP